MQRRLLAGHARLRPIDGPRSVEEERVRELSGEVDGFRTGQARHANANAELPPEARAGGDIEHRRVPTRMARRQRAVFRSKQRRVNEAVL